MHCTVMSITITREKLSMKMALWPKKKEFLVVSSESLIRLQHRNNLFKEKRICRWSKSILPIYQKAILFSSTKNLGNFSSSLSNYLMMSQKSLVCLSCRKMKHKINQAFNSHLCWGRSGCKSFPILGIMANFQSSRWHEATRSLLMSSKAKILIIGNLANFL